MFEEFIEKLMELYPTDKECEIVILEGYDCIEGPDGNKGFGVYDPEDRTIYVAEDIPEAERTIPHTIAHEYCHFLQDVNKKRYDECKALGICTRCRKRKAETGKTKCRNCLDKDALRHKYGNARCGNGV